MLAVRVIPTLLSRGHQLVKGKRFQSWRSVGHVQQAVRVHQARGVDELIILDITATPAGRGPDFGFIDTLTAECLMPLTVGGGIRTPADAQRLFAYGADKVSICSAYEIIAECAQRFGSQSVVFSLDVTGGQVATRCGTRIHTDRFPADAAAQAQKAGAGEILLTSIDREGTMEGYDLDMIRAVTKEVTIPVIAHGGCSGYEDMLRALDAGASAVAAGALFQFTDCTPRGAAQYLAARGIETRIVT